VDLDTVATGGALVFRSSASGRGEGIVGIVLEDGTVELNDSAAMSAVGRSWRAGVVSPLEVAQVTALLASAVDDAFVFREEEDLEDLRAEFAALVHVPRAETIDGHPAVVFWLAAGDPPFTRAEVVFGPDGATWSFTEIWELLAP